MPSPTPAPLLTRARPPHPVACGPRRALGLTLDSVPRLLLTELPGAFWLFYLCIPTRRPLSPPPESGPRGTRHRSGSEEAGEVSRGSERGHHGLRGAAGQCSSLPPLHDRAAEEGKERAQGESAPGRVPFCDDFQRY